MWPFLLGIALAANGAVAAEPVTPGTADPDKVLRYVLIRPETGFDPAMSHDLYSAGVLQSIFETLYTYDYLASPARLVPLTAEALPEVSADGKTYTIRLKKGIYFADDAAFGGKRRELTMQDYVYAWQRLFDPRLRSPNMWIFDGKILGMQAWSKSLRDGKVNYDSPLAGLQLLDRYTLRVQLTQPDFNFVMMLAHQPSSPMAREVVEKYQDENGQVAAHPVGTGAYALSRWVRGSRITLLANPGYRGFIWNFKPGSDAVDSEIVARMHGKRMPQIGRIELSVIVEDQARWLSFQQDQIDLLQLEGGLAPQALDDGKLKPELAARGIYLSRGIDPEISYVFWNMRDPIVGGLSKEKIALRRAITMAHDSEREVDVVLNDQAKVLQYPIPPGVIGYDPDYRSSIRYAPKEANQLLDRFGYKVGADGWRTQPDGSPLLIRYSRLAEGFGKLTAETWKKTYESLRIRMSEDVRTFPAMLKADKECSLQTRTLGWGADYPDGDNFMQLFAGPNIGQNNSGCVAIPEFDALYAESQKMPAGPERDLLFHKMARLLEVYSPVMIGYARYRNMLAQPRVIGYKRNPLLYAEWLYLDIDKR
ncbi:ABC transporter substrate-binding protein [Herbaspirillum lusitanum]|uniref:ABC transporter substrate-binding protein n=1 Tax=Herbaspirillum lusitanum TaxID=213312 RepID=A0ABW9A3W8_9BURK